MRDKWELHNDGDIRICIALGDGRCKQVAEAEIIGWTREEAVRHAERIINDHNQHATLVEQRDRLAAALTKVHTWLVSPARDAVTILEIREMVNAALATVEQPSPSTTGDEQGGGEL